MNVDTQSDMNLDINSNSKGNVQSARKQDIQRLVLAAFFVALGLGLPFVTMHIPTVGQLLSPMHLPVLLCGLVCGPLYGGIVGLIVPIFRSFLFGMPMLFPTAIAMSFELMTYGLVSGFIYKKTNNSIASIYLSLIPAMILGRIIGGMVQAVLLGGKYTISTFVTAYIINTFPGIILQLILIPIIMAAIGKIKHIK